MSTPNIKNKSSDHEVNLNNTSPTRSVPQSQSQSPQSSTSITPPSSSVPSPSSSSSHHGVGGGPHNNIPNGKHLGGGRIYNNSNSNNPNNNYNPNRSQHHNQQQQQQQQPHYSHYQPAPQHHPQHYPPQYPPQFSPQPNPQFQNQPLYPGYPYSPAPIPHHQQPLPPHQQQQPHPNIHHPQQQPSQQHHHHPQQPTSPQHHHQLHQPLPQQPPSPQQLQQSSTSPSSTSSTTTTTTTPQQPTPQQPSPQNPSQQPGNQPSSPAGPNRKIVGVQGVKSSSVNHSNIPARTHSAPPTLEEQHPNIPKPYLPEKRGINHGHHFIPGGYPNPPFNLKRQQNEIAYPPPPYVQYQYPYYQEGAYYPYVQQPQPPPSPTPAPQQQVRKRLAIIDPKTNEEVDTTSSPKPQQPTPPPATPSFSTGNETLRKQAASKQSSSSSTSTISTTTAAATSTDNENKSTADKPTSTVKSTIEEKETTTTPSEPSTPSSTGSESKKKEEPTATATTTTSSDTSVKSVTESIGQISLDQDSEKSTTTKTEETVKEEPVKVSTPPPQSTTSTDSTSSVVDPKTVEQPTNKVTTTTTATAAPSTTTEEEEEEWEKKGVDALSLPSSSSTSSTTSSSSSAEQSTTNSSSSTTQASTSSTSSASGSTSASSNPPFVWRSSGDRIIYTKEKMMSLRPMNVEEPSSVKEFRLNHQMEGGVPGAGGLNRSGQKIPTNKPMGMNPNYPPPNLNKYPPQMGMNMNKNYPQKNFNPNFKFQQQPQMGQGYQHPMYQNYAAGFQQQQQYQQQQQQQSNQPVNENRWVPTNYSALNDTQKILRKATITLNVLSPEKFDTLTNQLLELGVIDNEEIFKEIIGVIFDKALMETKYCTMYANLCKRLFEYEKKKREQERSDDFEKKTAEEKEAFNQLPKEEKEKAEANFKPKFRQLLLATCQQEYEKNFKSFDTIEHIPDDLSPQEKMDFEEKQWIERKRIFGLMKFIGELFKQKMLSEKVIHGILVALMGELSKPQEIKLECFCKLLSLIGKDLSEKGAAHTYMNGYYVRMEQLINTSAALLSQRIKFLIQNVLDLKSSGWVSKDDENTAKPLKELESNKPEEEKKPSTGVKTTAGKNMFMGNMSFPNFPKQPTIKTPPSTHKPAAGGAPGFGGIGGPNRPTTGGFMDKKPMPYNTGGSGVPSPTGGMGSGVPSPVSSNAALAKKWEPVKQQVIDSVNEFMSLNDTNEFMECMKEYVPSTDLYPFVFSMILSVATESKSNESKLKQLLIDLKEENFFTKEVQLAGSDKYISTLPDLYEDRPAAVPVVSSLLYSLYKEGMIPLVNLARSLSQQVQYSSLITNTFLEFVKQFNDMKKAASSFQQDKIDINVFFTTKDQKSIVNLMTSNHEDFKVFLDLINFK
eukprot:gene3219-4031_t